MKWRNLIIALIVVGIIGVGWAVWNNQSDQTPSTLTLATTTSTEDSGLLDALLPVFEEENNIEVKVVAVGTGQAIEIGKRGDADVLLVHSRKAEDEFVEEGYGVNRKDVMHNEFLIVGPESDPAGIKDMKEVTKAFQQLAEKEALFISRGDDSGTHKKEVAIWKSAGIEPQGDWYLEVGQGMGATLTMANERQAYTLTDEATYLSMADKQNLEVIVRGDEILFNPYGVIAINPEKHPDVNFEGANAFISFITGEKGQDIISDFGVEKFGKPLFTPDAI